MKLNYQYRNSRLSLGFIIVLVALLTACGSDEVAVTANFSNTQDINKGAPVYLDEQKVGQVTSVEAQGLGSKIEIEFDKDTANLIKSSAALVVNRLKEGAPLQVFNRNTSDQQPLQEGQELKGLDSMLQLGAWMIGDAIQLGSESVSGYVEKFQNYVDSEQFQSDKQVIQQKIEDAKTAALKTLSQVETDLNTAVDGLDSNEDEIARTMEKLGDELAPLVEELGKNGSELAQQFEEFSKSLEDIQNNKDSSEPKAGEKLLENLVGVLEKLNQSLEKGVAAKVEEE